MRISVIQMCLCLAFLFPAVSLHSQESGFEPNFEPNSETTRQEAADQEELLRERASQLRLQEDLAARQIATQRALESVRRGIQPQQPFNMQQPNRSPFPPTAPRSPTSFAPYRPNLSSELNQANQVANQAISKLVQQIRSSKDSAEKDELKAGIQEHLSTQYDAYLDHHEKPLKQLEERLQKLRDVFESRKKAKEDLVKLRLDTIWYDAIGLNWPAGNRGSSVPFFSNGAPAGAEVYNSTTRYLPQSSQTQLPSNRSVFGAEVGDFDNSRMNRHSEPAALAETDDTFGEIKPTEEPAKRRQR